MKAMATHSSTLAWKTHGWRSLVGYSPWCRKESDTTERLHFHFSLACIGEGNGNPLQCSCLENPRDGKPGGLPSMGSDRVGHDWSDLAVAVQEWEIGNNLNGGGWYQLWCFLCCRLLGSCEKTAKQPYLNSGVHNRLLYSRSCVYKTMRV